MLQRTIEKKSWSTILRHQQSCYNPQNPKIISLKGLLTRSHTIGGGGISTDDSNQSLTNAETAVHPCDFKNPQGEQSPKDKQFKENNTHNKNNTGQPKGGAFESTERGR